eukprot:m.129072 g.129072  ORF g.129072 m.129072 type:complete len:98 (-) comp16752_c0_seq1:97-390(-)
MEHCPVRGLLHNPSPLLSPLQVEMLRNPALRGRPVGVVQKSLVVTANTEARQLGVPKMCSVSEAKRAGGNALHLVLGEDLTLVRTKQSAENKLNDSS